MLEVDFDLGCEEMKYKDPDGGPRQDEGCPVTHTEVN